MSNFCRYLYLPLVDAERCWAYGMQLKSEANTEPRKRFHMVGRLKKAVHHAELLLNLCESDKCDARTKLEAQVHNLFFFKTCSISYSRQCTYLCNDHSQHYANLYA